MFSKPSVQAVYRIIQITLKSCRERPVSTAYRNVLYGINVDYERKFIYQGKEYTPQSFAASLQLNTDDYVCLTSFSHHPFYTQFILEVPDNWIWSSSYNLPVTEMMSIIDNALDNGYTVLWASDVSEAGYTRKGIAVVPEADPQIRSAELAKMAESPCIEKTITQEMRQEAFDNKQTTDDHAMHIFGIAKDQNGKKFYMVKNSYGTSSGYQGIWYASEAYVRYKTTNIMVHKNTIPATIKQKINLK